jgi:hypothetical protein
MRSTIESFVAVCAVAVVVTIALVEKTNENVSFNAAHSLHSPPSAEAEVPRQLVSRQPILRVTAINEWS